MSEIALENALLRAVVDPRAGAGLRAFQVLRAGTWLSPVPDSREPGCDLAASSFLMVPYSNRVADGAFAFQGKEYRLQRGEQHAIHGDVRKRPWQVSQRQADRLVCTFESAEHEAVNWPWPFAVRAEFSLREAVFSQHLTLWNRGLSAMPAGLGWHPYFNRALTRPGEPVLLCFRARAAYPDERGTRIPSGPPRPLRPEEDFSGERPLDPDNFLDTCFCGYDGKGSIAWPESGLRLRFSCSPVCAHLVLYNPAGKPYFAAEPVSNANDGFNLHTRGEPTSGVVVLEPGACLEARFDLQVEGV